MIKRLATLQLAHQRNEVNLATVSGVASTKKNLIKFFDSETDVSLITTKSYQVTPNLGNREPVICELSEGSFGNSVGLRNPGMEVALEEIKKLREVPLKKLLNISISASSVEDFVTLINAFDSLADSIELNFSCPHAAAGYGSSIGSDINIATEYVREIRKSCPWQQSALIVKLTPNVDDIGQIAKSVIEAGADGVAAINTVGPKFYPFEDTALPILNNKVGGKGGASGRWVHERAIEAIREIREAVGDEPLVLGMGGVFSAKDAVDLIEAGADSVGIGSALGCVGQKNWVPYLASIKREAEALLEGKTIEGETDRFIKPFNQMGYKAHKVEKVFFHSSDILILTLDGELEAKAGEFVFLFIPALGEKPFSVAHGAPLTFLIRARGEFTKALFKLKEGDKVWVRGPYGAPLSMDKKGPKLLLAGGSGVAVIPSLARLAGKGSEIDILVGTSEVEKGSDGKALFEDYLREYGSYKVVADNGKVGRVLDELEEHIKPGMSYYLVGPEKFMFLAAEKLTAAGVKDADICLSLERNTLCGIGMCGECVAGDRLTCQYGTFQSYDYIKAFDL